MSTYNRNKELCSQLNIGNYREYRERELEQGLTRNVTRFLLELGTGFAFVGSQVPLQVGEDNSEVAKESCQSRLLCVDQ